MARPVDPNLRIELLAAAEAEFARNGVAATRIDDIVLRARRSKGAFYQYFSGKEDIFRQLVEGMLARLGMLVARPLVTDDRNPPTRERFLQLWLERDEAIFDFIWVNRDLVRLVLRGGGSVAFADLMDAFAHRTYEMIFESLNWAKQHHIYRRDFNSHQVALMIAGAYDRLARALVDSDGNRPNLRALCVEAQSFVIHGIIDR